VTPAWCASSLGGSARGGPVISAVSMLDRAGIADQCGGPMAISGPCFHSSMIAEGIQVVKRPRLRLFQTPEVPVAITVFHPLPARSVQGGAMFEQYAKSLADHHSEMPGGDLIGLLDAA